jgi:hypothetical protein
MDPSLAGSGRTGLEGKVGRSEYLLPGALPAALDLKSATPRSTNLPRKRTMATERCGHLHPIAKTPQRQLTRGAFSYVVSKVALQ